MLSSFFRIGFLVLALFIAACASRDEARRQSGLQPEEGSQIPAATPGPGWEKVEKRPDATPTPPPKDPIQRPLDPTGLPQG